MEPSKYQHAIYDAHEKAESPIIVGAVAGSGKSRTLLESVQRSSHGDTGLFAFNKHIADNLKAKVPSDVRVQTIHAFGLGALREALDGRPQIIDNKYQKLALTMCDKDPSLWKGLYDRAWDAACALDKLASFSRLTLSDPTNPATFTTACEAYELTAPPTLVKALPKLLRDGAAMAEDEGKIDFTDMLYLPARWDLETDKFDCVMIDEAQDLSNAQLQLVLTARRAGAHALAAGDPAQAIMQFAYAGLDSFNDVKAGLGAQELPLSICYRCPSTHLALAQELVPQIEARPGAPIGTIQHVSEREFSESPAGFVWAGDMILCRNTAPLIETCLSLLQNRIPARVRGRDIGADLAAIIRQVGGSIRDFEMNLEAYQTTQLARLTKLRAPKGQIAALYDRVAGVMAAFIGLSPLTSTEEFLAKVQAVFSDQANGGVVLSTIHRAKGLEAERVWIIKPELLTRDSQAEANVNYVALTRAKDFLGFVEG